MGLDDRGFEVEEVIEEGGAGLLGWSAKQRRSSGGLREKPTLNIRRPWM